MMFGCCTFGVVLVVTRFRVGLLVCSLCSLCVLVD